MNESRFYATYAFGNGKMVSSDGVEFAPAILEKIAASCVADLVSKGWKKSMVQAEIGYDKITVCAYSYETQPGTYGDSAARSTFMKIGKKRYSTQARAK